MVNLKRLTSSSVKGLSLADIVGIVFSLAGLVGLIVNAVFAYIPGPVYRINTFFGVWLCSILFYFALQTIWLSRMASLPTQSRPWLAVWSILSLISFLLMVTYSIGQRIDGAVWSAVLFLVSLINILVIYVRSQPENEKSPVKLNSTVVTVLTSVNIFLLVFVFIFTILLLNGSFGMAIVATTVFPRGEFFTLKYQDGLEQKVHVVCRGPYNESFPVIWILNVGGHCHADFFGIQEYFMQQHRRSCIFDRPGVGFSDYQFAEYHEFFHEMIVASNETGPFVFVGWAGGGSTGWEYAQKYPDQVYAISLLDYYAINGFEWLSPQYVKNLTAEETNQLRNEDLAGRKFLFDIIRSLGTVFRLMWIYYPYDPVNSYIPIEYYDTFHYLTQTSDKIWTTQWFDLMIDGSGSSHWNDSQIMIDGPSISTPVQFILTELNATKQCMDADYPLDSQDCVLKHREVDFADYARLLPRNKTTSNDTELIWCEGDDCGLDFALKQPEWTGNLTLIFLEKLLQKYPISTFRT